MWISSSLAPASLARQQPMSSPRQEQSRSWSRRIVQATIPPVARPRCSRLHTAMVLSASQSFYQNNAGGLSAHPVLSPRGELLIARSDQLAALNRAEKALAPELDRLERLNADELAARVPALNKDYVAAGLADPSATDMDVAAIHQVFSMAFEGAQASWSSMPRFFRYPSGRMVGWSKARPALSRPSLSSMPRAPGLMRSQPLLVFLPLALPLSGARPLFSIRLRPSMPLGR